VKTPAAKKSGRRKESMAKSAKGNINSGVASISEKKKSEEKRSKGGMTL